MEGPFLIDFVGVVVGGPRISFWREHDDFTSGIPTGRKNGDGIFLDDEMDRFRKDGGFFKRELEGDGRTGEGYETYGKGDALLFEEGEGEKSGKGGSLRVARDDNLGGVRIDEMEQGGIDFGER